MIRVSPTRFVRYSLVALAVFAMTMAPGCGRGFGSVNSGQAPDVQQLDGTAISFAGLRSPEKPTLLVYSTIWCESCRKERPHVEAWAKAHANNVRVVSVVSGSPVNQVVEANKRHKLVIKYAPMVVDASGALADHHGIHATPTLIMLGRDGGEMGRWGSIDKVPVPETLPDKVTTTAKPAATKPEPSAPAKPAAQPNSDPPAPITTPPNAKPAEPAPTKKEATDPDAAATVERKGRVLGTSFHVVIITTAAKSADAEAAISKGLARVAELDTLLSEWRTDSQVSRLNTLGATAAVPLGPELRTILKGARYVTKLTGGAFDITWKPLGSMWDMAERKDRWPAKSEITKALKHVGMSGLAVTPAGGRFERSGMQVGVAGVAKGYIIDSWFLGLVKAGFDKVIVNIGGDLRAVGTLADGSPRSYLIADPFAPTRRFAGRIEVGAAAVATSGNYWRQRQLKGPDGKPAMVGHIVDPRSGKPPIFDGSVTVLTKDAAMADAMATGLFILGPEAGLALAKRLKGVDAIYATRNGLKATVSVLPAR